MSQPQWPEEQPKQAKPAKPAPQPQEPARVKETVPGQPDEPPRDEPEELIRRFYTGGLPREEFATRMKAIGADFDFDMPPAIPKQPVNPDPTQPGKDAATKFPGAKHTL